jgi:transcription elongation factor Elf1
VRYGGDGEGRASSKPKEDIVSDKYEGEFYCVKCKEKRTASGNIVVNDKGTRMAKGKCPVCGTNLNRILGKA